MRQILLCAAMALAGCNDGPLLFTTGTPVPAPTGAQPPKAGNSVPAQSAVTLRNFVRTKDFDGNIRILGEAITTSSTPLAFVKATCTFKDSAGIALGEDVTYIVGRVVKMAGTNTNDNSAIRSGDTGYFDLHTSLNHATISSYDCVSSFNPAPSTAPSAQLQVQGSPTVTSEYNGDVMYVGSAKNVGSKPLIYGKVFAVTLSKTGAPLDVSFGYVTGTMAATPAGNTDTGLSIDQAGRFTVMARAPFSERGETTYLYGWRDVDTLGSPAASLAGMTNYARISQRGMHAIRNAEIANHESLIDNQE